MPNSASSGRTTTVPQSNSAVCRARTAVLAYTIRPPAVAWPPAVACLAGRLLDDSHAPSWWILADTEGNEACVCTALTRD